MLHYGRWGTGPVLEPGMFFTIEPMINLGRPETKVLDDDWTAVTKDRSLSAQFEHRSGVTETGLRDLHPLAGGAVPPDLGVAPHDVRRRDRGAIIAFQTPPGAIILRVHNSPR